MKLLLRYGADINAKGYHGGTALHMVTINRAFAPLIALGANPNIQDDWGQTCLHALPSKVRDHGRSNDLFAQMRPEINSIINGGANLEIVDHKGRTVLHAAVEANFGLTKFLLELENRPSISARVCYSGKSVLHLACKRNQNARELFELLINHGADPKWVDADRNTLLHQLATSFDGSAIHVALARRIVDLGVSVQAKNSRKQTAAHVLPSTDYKGHESITDQRQQTFINLLLELDSNFNVNEADMNGCTALHYASSYSESLTFSLILAGAAMDARNHNLRTALHCAARGRRSTILAMLIKMASQQGLALDIDARDIDGRTPLHDACRSGIPESVRILIDAGADVNKRDKKKMTPLMICSEFVKEQARWSSLRSEPCSTNTPIRDDFRHVRRSSHDRLLVDESDNQDHYPRIGVVAKTLVIAGGSTKRALDLAIRADCAELVVAIRSAEALRKTSGFPLLNPLTLVTAGMPVPQLSNTTMDGSFRESFMLQSSNLDQALNSYNGIGPKENLAGFIPRLNESAMDLIMTKGSEFASDADQKYSEALAMIKMAEFGLTEYAEKIINRAKFLDAPMFLKAMHQHRDKYGPHYMPAPPGEDKCQRPLLQIACERSTWNMDMVRLIVEADGVDVNAHASIFVSKSDPDDAIPGETALHVLARGTSWWHAQAIEYLVAHGNHVH
jgi:ankyrin repeat protein